jgi:hypothetical protein
MSNYFELLIMVNKFCAHMHKASKSVCAYCIHLLLHFALMASFSCGLYPYISWLAIKEKYIGI